MSRVCVNLSAVQITCRKNSDLYFNSKKLLWNLARNERGRIYIFYFYADSYYLPVFLTYNLCEKYSLYFFFQNRHGQIFENHCKNRFGIMARIMIHGQKNNKHTSLSLKF